jgi:hypothetical protein
MKSVKFNHLRTANHFEADFINYRSETLSHNQAVGRSRTKRSLARADRRTLKELTQEEVTESIVTTQLAFDFKPIHNPQYEIEKTEWVQVGPNEWIPIHPETKHEDINRIVRMAIFSK